MSRDGAPAWFVIWAGIAAGMVAIIVGVGIYEVMDERGENRGQCEQTVGFREDARAMWLELFKAFPEAAESTGLRAFLEEKQPPLMCVGSDPQPVPVTTLAP